ncbi:TPA: hypothetical protein ACSTJ2_002425 [Serratia fonticola]
MGVRLSRQRRFLAIGGGRSDRSHEGISMKRWNEAEDKVLKESASTLSAKQISCLLGRTEKSVGVRAAIIGVSMRKSGDAHHSRKYSEADIDLAHQLHDTGMKLNVIAEKLEIPATSLKNYFY